MENTQFLETLHDGLDYFHLSADKHSLELYFRYFELLVDWNTRMNLVSDRDMDRFVEYHLLDSLKIRSCIDFTGFSQVIDFGTGAGLPGIPLSISLPNCHFTLIDSILKRTRFLETVVSTLSLSNVTVLRSRVEELPTSLNASFDAVVTRATVSLSSFFSSCVRFLKPSGILVSIKGENISEELESLRSSQKKRVFNIRDCVPDVPESVRSGHVIIIPGH